MNHAETDLLTRFADASRAYCVVVDSASGSSAHELLEKLQPPLARLALLAVELSPQAPGADAGDQEEKSLWNGRASLTATLIEILGANDRYWTIFDPRHLDSAVEGSLADDLVDIYADLQDALTLIDRSGADHDAIWTLWFTYWHHWGRHLFDALRVIFAVRTARAAAGQ